MLRSRDIADYFDALLDVIRPGEELGFDVHLYFPINRHIMLWRKKGEAPAPEFLKKYKDRKIQKIWIHRSDEAAFKRYIAPKDVAPPPPPPEPPKAALTREGAFIAEVMKNKDISKEQKKEILSDAARALIQQNAAPKNLAEQKAADQKARATVQDVLMDQLGKSESLIAELWKLANIDPEIDHAASVATFVVIFAMAFGRVDSALLADLALAGLLHDIGLSQIPAHIASKPWTKQTPEETAIYSKHVHATLALAERLTPELPARVKALILQHHEKFNGTGYPQGLKGFKVDDVAALLAIADVLASINGGRWDGTPRTTRDTLAVLEKIEGNRTFPQYFNPEVFAEVMRWVRSPANTQQLEGASQIVGNKAREFMHQAS